MIYRRSTPSQKAQEQRRALREYDARVARYELMDEFEKLTTLVERTPEQIQRIGEIARLLRY